MVVNKILWVMMLALKIILIIIVTYTIYMLIFSGYSRLLSNILFFKFNHKENIEKHLHEGDLLQKHIEFFTNGLPSEALETMKYIYNTHVGNITNEFLKIKQPFIQSIKEFFIFNEVIYDKTPEKIVLPGGNIKIVDYFKFYNLLGSYLINIGEIDSKAVDKSPNALTVEMFETRKHMYNRIKETTDAINKIANQVQSIMNNFISLPISSYIILPKSNDTMKQYQNALDSKFIPTNLNNETYALLEVFKYPQDWDRLKKDVPPYNATESNYIISYLNLTNNERISLRKKMNWENQRLFRFIELYPIFSHIYFSSIVEDKQSLYRRVINFYKPLDTLNKRGDAFKKCIISSLYLNYYFNTYKTEMTRMYKKQLISPSDFLKELYTPIYEDIFEGKILDNVRITFGKENWGNAYGNFKRRYDDFGSTLKNHSTRIFKAFFTSQKIENPKESAIRQ